MRILAIETSMHFTYLALCVSHADQMKYGTDDRIWKTEKFSSIITDKKKDNWLELAIHEFCDSFKPAQLDGFAAGCGPGSFTGLRINFTYLKTLAIMWNKAFLTFSTSRFYHSLYCKAHDALLVQLNRNLFFACDPDLAAEGNRVQTMDEWAKHYMSQPQKKIQLWRQYPLQINEEPSAIPEINPEQINAIENLNFEIPNPEYILKNKKELMSSQPWYGHDIILNRK